MSSDEKALKPSERIEDIFKNFMCTSDKDVAPIWGKVHAIIRYLDEQSEILDTHTAKEDIFPIHGSCENTGFC